MEVIGQVLEHCFDLWTMVDGMNWRQLMPVAEMDVLESLGIVWVELGSLMDLHRQLKYFADYLISRTS